MRDLSANNEDIGELEVLNQPPARIVGFSDREAFVAEVAGTDCSVVEREINAVVSRAAVFSTQSRDEARELPVGSVCFVRFRGSESVRRAVAALDKVIALEAEPYGFAAESVSWGLDRLDSEHFGDMDGEFAPGFRGAGVNVYVLDSGVDISHPDFSGRARYGANFVIDEGDSDLNSHGTHCAGTVGGLTTGVAKSSTIVSIKVIGKDGGGGGGDFISGISWAVKEQQRLFPGPGGVPSRTGVISMSVVTNTWSPLDHAVRAAQASNMVVVVAAGNDRRDASSRSPSNAGGSARSDHGPITVGAIQKGDGEDAYAYFSNYGTKVDIAAPGRQIMSTCLDHSYCSKLGTSMAAPHVAGAMAVLLEKHAYDKDAAMDELFAIAVEGKINMDNADTSAQEKGDPVPTQTANLVLQVPSTSGPTTKAPTPRLTLRPSTAPLAGNVPNSSFFKAPSVDPTNSNGFVTVAAVGVVAALMAAGVLYVFQRRRRRLSSSSLPTPIPPPSGFKLESSHTVPTTASPWAYPDTDFSTFSYNIT